MAAIQTPCTKVCTMDPVSGLCLGCGRTITEIGGWGGYSDAERARIMAELPRRSDTMRPRRATAGAL